MPNVTHGRASYVALSLQETLWPRLEATSSNLSNAGTPGFKALIAKSREVPYQARGQGSVSYVELFTVERDVQQGPLKSTGNTFDLAISGKGYFRVAGDTFTRAGNFQRNIEGKLVTASGQAVLDAGGGEITVPYDAGRITIASDGTISGEKGNFGQLGVVQFADEQKMIAVGGGLYRTDQGFTINPEAEILQGFIEESTVAPIQETINMITINRLYEQAQALQREEDQLIKQMINTSARNSG